jgi:hypothetical protein
MARGQTTQCVRRFGLTGRHTPTTHSLFSSDRHVTAAKLSDVNGRDVGRVLFESLLYRQTEDISDVRSVFTIIVQQLVVTFSGDDVYLFDIHREPGEVTPLSVLPSSSRKRKRSNGGDASDTESKKQAISPRIKALRMEVIRRLGILTSRPIDRTNGEGVSALVTGDVDPALALVLLGRLERLKKDRAVNAARAYAMFLNKDPPEDVLKYGPEAAEILDAIAYGERGSEIDLLKEIIRETWGSETLRADGAVENENERGGETKMAYEVNIDEDGDLQVAYSTIEDDDEGGGGEDSDDGEEMGEDDDREEDDEDMDDDDEDDEDEEDSEDEPRWTSRMAAARQRESRVDQQVPIVYPIQSYSGHRNEETVRLSVDLSFRVFYK